MENTLKSKTVDLVFVSDLDSYIEKHLGRPWRTQQDRLDGQDTLRVLEVAPDSGATAKVEEWLASPVPEYSLWSRDEVLNTEDLLSELCNRGLLPEGSLYVHIWW